MAEKKETAKKATKPRKSVTKKVEQKETVKQEVIEQENKVQQQSNDPMVMNKILVCLYVIIAILVVNTTILAVRGTGTTTTKSNGNTTDEQTSGEYDVSMFKTITVDNLAKEISGNDSKIVYIGRSTCGFCVQFLPTLQKAQEKYGYETLYLDITQITSVDQKSTLLAFDNDDKFLDSNFGATPMVLLMKDGKLVDTWLGYAEYDTFAKWLEENGFEAK